MRTLISLQQIAIKRQKPVFVTGFTVAASIGSIAASPQIRFSSSPFDKPFAQHFYKNQLQMERRPFFLWH